METSQAQRPLVKVTAVIGGIWFFFLLTRAPLADLPLYGFYPGQAESGAVGYNPKAMHIWAFIMAAIYLCLYILTVFRRNRIAAASFLVLFVVSTVVALLRVAHTIGGIH
jgi:hypothetical protein